MAYDLLEEMLLPDERSRLNVLRVEDSDDVPTPTLAIALGALPITRDHAPWKAVHGARTDAAHLDLWLSRLMSIGNRAETEKLISIAFTGVSALNVAAVRSAMRCVINAAFPMGYQLSICALVASAALAFAAGVSGLATADIVVPRGLLQVGVKR